MLTSDVVEMTRIQNWGVSPTAGAAVLAMLLWLASSSIAVASGRPPRAETNREVATALARRLLAAAILPSSEGSSGLTLQAQAPAPELDQPMDPIGSDDLIDIHRFWASSLSAADFVAFALAHRPAGTKLTEGSTAPPLPTRSRT